MKHFVVILDWATNDDHAMNIISVVHSFEEAKTILAEKKEEELKFAKEHDYMIETNSDVCFEAWEDGRYCSDHINLYIQAV